MDLIEKWGAMEGRTGCGLVGVCLYFLLFLAASGFHEASSSALSCSSTGIFCFSKVQTQKPDNCGLSLLHLSQTQSSLHQTVSLKSLSGR